MGGLHEAEVVELSSDTGSIIEIATESTIDLVTEGGDSSEPEEGDNFLQQHPLDDLNLSVGSPGTYPDFSLRAPLTYHPVPAPRQVSTVVGYH